MMHLVFDKNFKHKEATFECENALINKDLLYKLLFGNYDSDGFEYEHTIFDIAEGLSI